MVFILLNNRSDVRLPVNFIALFGLTIASNAIYGTFLPVYLHRSGFTDTLIGTLLAIGPFVAFPAQPFWGLLGDRARSKNTILRVMLVGSAAAVLLYPLFKNFYYLFAVITAFTFFNISMLPMQDAIVLEAIEGTGWRYGTIRMAGTIGYAIMSVIAGLLSGWNIYIIFPLYSFVALAGFFATFRIPVVVGHQSAGRKVAPWKLLKNKRLVALMAFTFVLSISLGYYNSFFSIYYSQMGASTFLVGISMFCSSGAEIPFLFFSNRIIARFGVRKTLIVSGAVMGLRWMLLYLVSNVYAIPFINMLHGCSYIVLAYCMVTFINEEVPMELRASGQTLYALATQGVARIIGSILGGFTSDVLGVRAVFLYSFAINVLAVAVFGVIWYLEKRRRTLRFNVNY
jgi:MFS transporter, PPP family, 3-phenylpropionic acid transporter